MTVHTFDKAPFANMGKTVVVTAEAAVKTGASEKEHSRLPCKSVKLGQ